MAVAGALTEPLLRIARASAAQSGALVIAAVTVACAIIILVAGCLHGGSSVYASAASVALSFAFAALLVVGVLKKQPRFITFATALSVSAAARC